jgi:2-hydroxycyclohexanecarboxyl-CoA dehydrogenase
MQGKKVFVTGGANGCGEAAVRGCLSAGASVVLTDINDERGQFVVEEVGAGDRCSYVHLDVSSREDVFRVVKEGARRMGGIDALVNAAGNVIQTKPEETTDADWDKIFNVHVKGTLYTNQAVFPYLKQNGGAIVNFGSAAGVRGNRTFSVYGAAKGAVLAWTRNLALEWAQYNIRVNAICPVVDSEMQRTTRASLTEENAAILAQDPKRILLNNGELADPNEGLTSMIVLLAGDGGRWITGQTIAVDGGYMMLGS